MVINDSTPNFTALAEFRFQLRKFLAASADAAKEAGIDPTQHQLLLVLKGLSSGKASIGYIAERLLIRHNSAVELVSRCELNGWVLRMREDDDRRIVQVALTEKGENILVELSTLHVRELQSAAPDLICVLQDIVSYIPETEKLD